MNFKIAAIALAGAMLAAGCSDSNSPSAPSAPTVSTTTSHSTSSSAPLEKADLSEPVVARLKALGDVRDALEEYRAEKGEYPKTDNWLGKTRGQDAWVPGLAPDFISALPGDPEPDTKAELIYRSNGADYKLIANQAGGCEEVRSAHPEMVDAVRDTDGKCFSYGYWTEGGKDF